MDLPYLDLRTNTSARLIRWEHRGILAGVLFAKGLLLASLLWSPHSEVRPFGLSALLLFFTAAVLHREARRQFLAEHT